MRGVEAYGNVPSSEWPIISEPLDWLEYHLVKNRDQTMELFNQLTDERKEQLNNCFDDGDADVFRNVGSANGFIDEGDDPELAEAKDKVEKLVASW